MPITKVRTLLAFATMACISHAAGFPTSSSSGSHGEDGLHPIPDRLVVLTFDDSTKPDITTVAPILKHYGFGATFYVTNGLRRIRHNNALTWEDIRALDEEGFEIGNHTENHVDLTKLPKEEVTKEVKGIEREATSYGIPRPITFAYPGFRDNLETAEVLLEKGYLFARRGVTPEFHDAGSGARGPAYDPKKHHPLFIPTTGYGGPQWHFADLVWAVSQARGGKIAVLTFHGVPFPGAPWVSVEPRVFAAYMKYLHDLNCTVIAMRDLREYVRSAPVTQIALGRETGTGSGN